MADSRSPDRRIVDGLREFYLGYLSKHLPMEAFDRVRRSTVTDVAMHILRDIRAEVEPAAPQPAECWVCNGTSVEFADDNTQSPCSNPKCNAAPQPAEPAAPATVPDGVPEVDKPNSPAVQKAMVRFYRKRMEVLLADYRNALMSGDAGRFDRAGKAHDALMALADGVKGGCRSDETAFRYCWKCNLGRVL